MRPSFILKGLCLAALVGASSVPQTLRAADFVGAAACRACHQAAFDQWKSSPHAKAFTSLTADQQKNQTCLQCHARDVAQGGDPGVTCETCHGAGQYYWPSYVMRDKELAHAAGLATVSAQDPKSCAQCHNGMSPSLEPFDPAKKMQAIDHWSKDRAMRGQRGDACPRPNRAGGQLAAARPAQTFLGQALRAAPKQPASPSGKAGGSQRVEVAQGGQASARIPVPAAQPN